MNKPESVNPEQLPTGEEMLNNLEWLDVRIAQDGRGLENLAELQGVRDDLAGQFNMFADFAAAEELEAESRGVTLNYPKLPETEASETAKDRQTDQEITLESPQEELWGTLSEKSKKFFRRARTAMAAKFDRHKADFSLLQFTEKDSDGVETPRTVMAYTATDRLAICDGSLIRYTLRDRRMSWTVKVGDKQTDTRSGATESYARALGKSNPDIRELFWLTVKSEDSDCVFGSVASVDGDHVSILLSTHVKDPVGYRPLVVGSPNL